MADKYNQEETIMKDIVIAAVLFFAISEVAMAHNIGVDHIHDGGKVYVLENSRSSIPVTSSGYRLSLPRVERKRCDYNDAISGSFCNIVYDNTRRASQKARWEIDYKIQRKIDRQLGKLLR